jgi:hypothetical protein
MIEMDMSFSFLAFFAPIIALVIGAILTLVLDHFFNRSKP